jgi:hypothetical protein
VLYHLADIIDAHGDELVALETLVGGWKLHLAPLTIAARGLVRAGSCAAATPTDMCQSA